MNNNIDERIILIFDHLEKIKEDMSIDFILETIFKNDLTSFIKDMRYFSYQNKRVNYNRLFGKKLDQNQKQLILDYYKIMEENILCLLEFFKIIDSNKEKAKYIKDNILKLKNKINDIKENINFIISYFENKHIVIVKAQKNK